jgi:hypothetical protein
MAWPGLAGEPPVRSGAMIAGILVGGIPTPLKNMKVSWDDEIPNIWKNKTCSKPPTSEVLISPLPLESQQYFDHLDHGISALMFQLR